MLRRDSGGVRGTIVVEPEGLRAASSFLIGAAERESTLGARIRSHPIPELPPGLGGLRGELAALAAVVAAQAPVLQETAQELRVRALWADIADKLTAGVDLDGALLDEFKVAIVSGLLTRYGEPWQDELASAYVKKVEDEEEDGGGFFGFVKDVAGGIADFFEGAWDAVAEPVAMLYRLTPLNDGWTKQWEQFGSGLAYGVTHPVEFGKAVIALDALEERGVAYWLGNLGPAAAATVLSGGAAAGIRGAQGAAALQRGMRGAAAAERLADGPSDISRLAAAAEAGAVRLTAAGDRFGEFASRAKPLPGYTDIVVHGAPHGFADTPTGRLMSAKEVADLTRANAEYGGGAVRLIACNTGCPGATAAPNLARELGVEILAPDDVVWAFPSGKLTIGPTPTADTGAWVRFDPEAAP